jgi:N-methylhydantoinase B
MDPVLIETLWSRLISVAEEQAKALYRGSFSVSTSEVEDYCSTIHDAKGRMIAQSFSSGTISMLTGQTMSITQLADRFGHSVEPGDAIIWNDPWLLAGHKYDVVMASPVFLRARLVGWAVTSLHAADIGGRGFTAASKDTYEEGLTFPPLFLFRRGKPNSELFDFIKANVRMPDQVAGDFMAQSAANSVGAEKILQLMSEYDLTELGQLADEITNRSEAKMRAAITRLSDGTYVHEAVLDGFDVPLVVRCALTVKGDEIEADFAGTSPQVDGAINAVGYVAYGRVVHAVKSALVPRIPNNEGLFRPISVTAPLGSLVNATHPAATAARHILHFFIASAAFGALAKIVPTPDGVLADSGAGMIMSVRERHNGRPQDYWIRYNNGMGGTLSRDGYSGMCAPNNVGTTPIEIIENRTNARFLEKELVPDSAGPGTFRGGFAQRYSFVVTSESPTQVSFMFDRTRHPPLGLLGGGAGRPASVLINGHEVDPKGQYDVSVGDVISVIGPGGGGVLEPWKRQPEMVQQDVVNELVTRDVARDVYRVVVDARSQVDSRATKELRRSLT